MRHPLSIPGSGCVSEGAVAVGDVHGFVVEHALDQAQSIPIPSTCPPSAVNIMLDGPGRRCIVLMNQSSRDYTLLDVRPSPGPGRGAVSRQSSRDKRRKRSLPGTTVRREGRAISARLSPAVERAAAKASQERPVRMLRAGWWVFAYGPAGGAWAQVVAIEWRPQGQVRVKLRYLDGSAGVVETSRSAPMSYLAAGTAQRVGLAGGGR